MTQSKIFKIGFFLIFFCAAYGFGASSVKLNLFPFGYQIGGWVKWASKKILPERVENEDADANIISYEENIISLLYDYDIKWFPADYDESYGAIVPLTKSLILYISQYGEVSEKNLETGRLKKLKIPTLPLNSGAFEEFTLSNNITSAYDGFGVKDAVIIRNRNKPHILLVSSTYFDTSEKCLNLRVFTFDLNSLNNEWKVVFQSSPCIYDFDGMPSWGSGLAVKNPSSVYLSLGDVLHDGVNYVDLISPEDSDYGKVHLIDLEEGISQKYSGGHRNPQGIIVAKSGEVLSVEHGPEGGDELNLILKDKHYGWPLRTFGTDYGAYVWPLNDKNGSHEGFEQPLMTWTPAIGPSDLTEISGSESLWENDILISGLRGMSIFRLKRYNQGINFIEKIELDRRIRKIESIGNRVFLKDQASAEIGFFDIPQLKNVSR